jgi:endonuclease YncB( thermonuclease family)
MVAGADRWICSPDAFDSTQARGRAFLRHMRVTWAVITICIWLGASAFAGAQSGTAQRLNDRGLIEFTTESGETLTVRLAGLEFPPDGAPGNALAMCFIDQQLAGASARLAGQTNREDRYGNLIADIDLGNGTLAETLVRSGFAMAYSWPDSRQEAASLMPLEADAREARRGLWATGIFAIRTPDVNTLALYLETVQIIEGRVISIGDTRDRVYLNFGFDYRTDFTVSIERRHTAQFAEAGINLTDLEGRIVRVRGWVLAINGPSISIDHPERLEILTP